MDKKFEQQSSIFISHSHQDAVLTSLVKAMIETVFEGGFKIEATSHKDSAEELTGSKWRSFILENIQNADFFIVLLTPNSIGRPWVMFESGAAWYDNETKEASTDKKLIPCLFGVEEIPSILSEYGGINLSEHDSLERLFPALASKFQIKAWKDRMKTAMDTFLKAANDISFGQLQRRSARDMLELEAYREIISGMHKQSTRLDVTDLIAVLHAHRIIDTETATEFLQLVM